MDFNLSDFKCLLLATIAILVCKGILEVVQNEALSESVILLDSTESDVMKTAISNVAEQLKFSTVGHDYCLDAHQCDKTGNSYYVPVSELIRYIFIHTRAVGSVPSHARYE